MSTPLPGIRSFTCQAAIIGFSEDGPKGHEVIQMLTQIMHHYDDQLSNAETVAIAKWFHETYTESLTRQVGLDT